MNRRGLFVALLGVVLGVVLGLGWARIAGQSAVGTGTSVRSQPAAQTTAPSPEGIVFSATNQAPAATPDLLPAGVPIVYAFYNLPDSAQGGLANVAWKFNGKTIGEVPRGDVLPDTARPGAGTVLLRAPSGKFVPGAYELQMTTSRRRYSASFVLAGEAAAILAQPAPTEAELTIPEHVLAQGVDKGGKPVRPTKAFGGRERIYYVLRYERAEPGMAIVVQWWGGGVEIKAARREVTLPAEAGWAQAWVEAPAGLPAGNYEVTATTGGDTRELVRDAFTVR